MISRLKWSQVSNTREPVNKFWRKTLPFIKRRFGSQQDGQAVRGEAPAWIFNDDNNNRCSVESNATDAIGRLELLEEALKESIAITVQAELQAKLKEEALTAAQNKIRSLESVIASGAACGDCEMLRNQMRLIGQTLTLLRAQRNKHLEDIFDLKFEALSTAISEIDEQAAHLELSCREEDRRLLQELREEREKLRRRIKTENDNRVRILQQLDREAQLAPQPKGGAVDGSSRCPRVRLIWPSCDDGPALTGDERTSSGLSAVFYSEAETSV